MAFSTRIQSWLVAALLSASALGCEGATDEEGAMDDDDESEQSDEQDEGTDGEDDADDERDAASSREDGGRKADAGARPSSTADASAGADLDASMMPPRGGSSRSDGGRGPGGDTQDSAVATPTTPSEPGAVSTDDVPAGEHCASVASFSAEVAKFEEEVLALTNAARATGFNCDSKGMFGPTTPLKMDARLRCSARLHSKYMAETGDFAHTQSATGSDPFARMKAAGYSFFAAGENIAAGQRTPKEVVDGWLQSDGHCENIMSPNFSDLGVGYVVSMPKTGSRAMPYWTQNFGRAGR